MFSLLLLAGILLAYGGPEIRVQGTRNAGAAAADFDTEDLIEQIIHYERTLRREQEKRDNEANILADFKEEQGAIQGINLKGEENGADVEDKTVAATVPTAVTHGAPEALSHANHGKEETEKDTFFLKVIVMACAGAGLVGLIMAGVCWYKLQSRVKAASDVEYPAYGVTGPTKERLPSPGDRKLAQSAQMYHYQHQKQQMIAMEKANGEMKQDASEDESEEENEEGDYTVYECPGLAPTGEMEVRNPLFTEESQTPVNGQPPIVNGLGSNDTAE